MLAIVDSVQNLENYASLAWSPLEKERTIMNFKVHIELLFTQCSFR